ncbi:MAG: methyltransferase domain-containing protein [Myxococcota bacterium]|nr:methyltransferase domain-containing protein [Myxococcota bacterium]
MTAPFLSIVIPAADEAANIGSLLEELGEVLRSDGRPYETIVVIARPDDPTGEVAAAGGARVLCQKRPGYGGALKEGLLAARGEYVVTLDADGSHPPAAVAKLLAHRDDAEVVVCSRYVEGASAALEPGRRLLSRLLNWVYSRALALPIRDVSSGFRLYRRRVFDEIEILGEKYDVLEEILVQIYSQGWRIVEIPFDYLPRVSGESHARALEFLPHFLTTLLRLFRMRNHFSVADYDSRAYDSLVVPQRYWQRRRFSIVNEMAGSGGRRLDIGCGSSRIIQSRPDSVGIDIERAKLRFLRRTNPLLVRASTYDLPIADESFDVVVHSQVIEHIPYDRKIFTEINRVLRPGGTLVIGTPDYGRVQWRLIEFLYKVLMPNGYGDDHITHYTRQSLIEEIADAGFAVRRYGYILGGELVIEAEKRDAPGPRSGRPPAIAA